MPRRPFKGTRGDRLRRRLEILGEQATTPSRGMARHVRLKLAGLRRTDSGMLTRKPEQLFVLQPMKSTPKAKTEQQRYQEKKEKEEERKRATQRWKGKKSNSE